MSLLAQMKREIARSKGELGPIPKATPNQKTHTGLVGPDGTVYPPITNLAHFCRENDLDYTAIWNVCKGIIKRHRGWRLQTTSEK